MKKFLSLLMFVALLAFFSQKSFAKEKRRKEYTADRVMASVRIGRGGGCSGTIFTVKGQYAYGITAAHCAGRDGSQFEFGNPDGSTGSARWIASSLKYDLALFKVWKSDVLGHVHIPKMLKFVPNGNALQIEACGYPGGAGPKWKVVTDAGREGYGQGCPSPRWQFNVKSGRFGPGDSGGGIAVIEDRGGNEPMEWLVSVITHGEDNRFILGAEHSQIKKFLTEQSKNLEGANPYY